MRFEINDVQLCFETFGDAANPAILLIAGGASSMDRWEPEFCERLAAAGRHVIRYDHRDTGGSTTYPPGQPGYTGDDLDADALALLDHLRIERAHLVGISMGAGISQDLALNHPERVRSVTLIATSPIGPGERDLPGMSDELRAMFSEEPVEPDWADREAAIAYLLEGERPYTGSRGLDEDAILPVIARAYDRTSSPASANNHFIADGGSEQRRPVSEIAAPTLVIHGSEDPMFPLPHGEALAREVPDATLLVVDGMGHEFPRSAWDEVLPALIAHTA
jgi:pimeloyl-ACP methyl ester carboxylesterase